MNTDTFFARFVLVVVIGVGFTTVAVSAGAVDVASTETPNELPDQIQDTEAPVESSTQQVLIGSATRAPVSTGTVVGSERDSVNSVASHSLQTTETVSLMAENVTGQPGDEVTVAVETNTSLLSYEWVLEYNESVVNLSYDTDPSEAVSSSTFPPGTVVDDGGAVSVAGLEATDQPGPHTWEVTFEIVGQMGDETPLEWNESATKLSTNNSEFTPGDLRPGKVTVPDTSQNVQLTAGNATGQPGDEVTVAVETNTSLLSYEWVLEYNESVVNLSYDTDPSEAVSSSTFPPGTVVDDGGAVSVAGFGATDQPGPHTWEVTFEIVGQMGDETLLEWNESATKLSTNDDGEFTPGELNEGAITVGSTALSFPTGLQTSSNVANETAHGEELTVEAPIANAGTSVASADVVFELRNATGDQLRRETMTVDGIEPGNETVVTATVILGTDLDAGSADGVPYTYSFTLDDAGETASNTIDLYELGDVDHNGDVGPLDAANTLRSSQGRDPIGETFNPAAGAVAGDEPSPFNAAQVLRISQGLDPTVDWEVDTTVTLTAGANE